MKNDKDQISRTPEVPVTQRLHRRAQIGEGLIQACSLASRTLDQLPSRLEEMGVSCRQRIKHIGLNFDGDSVSVHLELRGGSDQTYSFLATDITTRVHPEPDAADTVVEPIVEASEEG